MRIARALVDALRLALAREKLGREAPPPQAPASPPTHGVLHVLFVSREPLGTEPEAPAAARRSLLRAVLAREVLPLDPVPSTSSRRRGRLAALFSVEKLDDDSP